MKQLIKRKGGTFFESSVDPDAFGIPDYWEIVDRPLDLGTICGWMESNAYDRSRGLAHEEIADDVRRVFANAMMYNAPGSEVFTSAEQLGILFEQQFLKISEEIVSILSAEASSAYRSASSRPSLSNTNLPQRALKDFFFLDGRGLPEPPEDWMQPGVMAAGTVTQPGAELLSGSAGLVTVKLKVEEVFHEFFPDSDDAQLTVWVRGQAAWYRLTAPHAAYADAWEPYVQRTRLGEQVKAFLDRYPRAAADKMLQAVAKKGYDGAVGRQQKGRDRQPRGAEVGCRLI